MDKSYDIINEFKSEIKKLYGKNLKRIILYGSFARNENTKDSDIDLLIVLEEIIQPGRELDRMVDIITDINLKYDSLLSIYPISEKNYLTLKSPLLMNIRKEGLAQ